MRNPRNEFFQRGWCRFAFDAELSGWVEAALPAARQTLRDPAQAKWLRYGDTWFAGVNALPNDASGEVAGSGPLRGAAVDFIGRELGLKRLVWDAAQVSVCFPGYPRPMAGESPARARFRREHDAAHVDGLLPEGPARRRHLREHHGFILGIPMVEFDAGASPFVVWEGSHEIMRAAFAGFLVDTDPRDWGKRDITEIYHHARRRAFAECSRVEVHARPGEAFIAHRLVLHGMAPWRDGAEAGADGRMICYFRPAVLGPREWLFQP